MKQKLMMVALLAMGLAACNKESAEETARTRGQLLLGSWVFTSILYVPAYDYNLDGVLDTETINTRPSCETDGFFTFKADGTHESDEGPTKCQASNPQITTGVWKLIDNDQSLVIDGDTVKILQLDETVLKFSNRFLGPGSPNEVIATAQRR